MANKFDLAIETPDDVLEAQDLRTDKLMDRYLPSILICIISSLADRDALAT